MTGVAKGTAIRLLEDVGDARDLYQDETIRNLTCVRVQCDEIWSFCQKKERRVRFEERGQDIGDLWTWTAIDADTELVICWFLGKRTAADADVFIRDLSQRISSFVQISTDGFSFYNEPIQRRFGYRADHGSEVKDYGLLDDASPERKYSPMVVKRVGRKEIWGAPMPEYISTAYVERQNLKMRMSMRRFTRLTNGFSKKAQNLQRALALHFMYYNFCRKHQTLKTTPAIKAGLTNRIWTLHDLARLPDIMRDSKAA